LQANSDDADTLAGVLLALRTVLPLKLAQDVAGSESASEGWADPIAELRQQAVIGEQPARSTLPVVGPLLTALRQPWNRAITAAYVLPMIHQQIQFNTGVVALLERLSQRRRDEADRLRTVLLEYLRESNRELGELAAEVRGLRALIEKDLPQD
jgi:hypothetical protein